MKKIFLILFLAASFVVSNAQSAASAGTAKAQENTVNAGIEFESKVVDYGVIEHNSNGERAFKFKSTGTDPLIIKSAKGSCGVLYQLGEKLTAQQLGNQVKMVLLV